MNIKSHQYNDQDFLEAYLRHIQDRPDIFDNMNLAHFFIACEYDFKIQKADRYKQFTAEIMDRTERSLIEWAQRYDESAPSKPHHVLLRTKSDEPAIKAGTYGMPVLLPGANSTYEVIPRAGLDKAVASHIKRIRKSPLYLARALNGHEIFVNSFCLTCTQIDEKWPGPTPFQPWDLTRGSHWFNQQSANPIIGWGKTVNNPYFCQSSTNAFALIACICNRENCTAKCSECGQGPSATFNWSEVIALNATKVCGSCGKHLLFNYRPSQLRAPQRRKFRQALQLMGR